MFPCGAILRLIGHRVGGPFRVHQSWDLNDLCVGMHALPSTPRLLLVVALVRRRAFFRRTLSHRTHNLR